MGCPINPRLLLKLPCFFYIDTNSNELELELEQRRLTIINYEKNTGLSDKPVLVSKTSMLLY